MEAGSEAMLLGLVGAFRNQLFIGPERPEEIRVRYPVIWGEDCSYPGEK